MLSELLDFVKNSTSESGESENKVIPRNPDSEDLELRNSSNANERHLLEFEKECNESILSIIGLDLSISLGLNAAVTWLVLNSLQSLTPDFSGFTFHLLSWSINMFATLPYLSNERVNKKYLLPLTFGRIALGYAVNGKIINTIESRVTSSFQSYNDLKAEIENYESGYKPQPNNSFLDGFGNISLLAGLIVIVIILRGLFNKS